MVFANAGTYSIIYSAQFVNDGNFDYDTSVWMLKNGSVLPDTNSVFTVPPKHGNDPGKTVGTVNYVLTLSAGDSISFNWSTPAPNNAGVARVYVDTIPSDGGIPQSPSVIVTATQVMYTQVGPPGPPGPAGGGLYIGEPVDGGTPSRILFEVDAGAGLPPVLADSPSFDIRYDDNAYQIMRVISSNSVAAMQAQNTAPGSAFPNVAKQSWFYAVNDSLGYTMMFKNGSGMSWSDSLGINQANLSGIVFYPGPLGYGGMSSTIYNAQGGTLYFTWSQPNGLQYRNLMELDDNGLRVNRGGFQTNLNGDISYIHSVPYVWPSGQGAASTVLTNNGSGTLSWSPVSVTPTANTATAANDLVLPVANLVTVSGSTQINAITTAGYVAGASVTLKFDNAPTVKNNTAGGAGTAPVFLAGSFDFATGNNVILGLIYDGTQWQETFRKVP